MSNLIDFLRKHVIRGQCRCGKCIDTTDPENQPIGHTSNLLFFDVALNPESKPSKEEFETLVREQKPVFGDPVDLFDGDEHSYLEIGGWIGDQTSALILMGAGELLGSWQLLTPMSMLNITADHPLAQKLAGAGFVTIVKGA